MKKSELSFMDGFTDGRGVAGKKAGATINAFDWDKAAEIIKKNLIEHPNLKAEAGLQRDWAQTGGIIFEDGKPTNGGYTYLSSNWAIPTLILEWDGEEQEEIECHTEQSDRFDSDTKWDETSLSILGVSL